MKNKATRNNMRGFSLMEMLVTVLILVILFALAMIPISKIQKNLRQTELDSRAEMIFSAVQNRMTQLQAAGQDSYYQPTGGVGVTKLNMIPEDADKKNYKETTLAYVTSADKKTPNSAASWIYPETEAEADLWNANWVVEFDPSSGSVYAVFFSRENMDYTPKDFDDLELRYRDKRLEKGAKIGYYGGDSVGAAATESLDLTVDVINKDQLLVVASCKVNLRNKLQFYAVIKDESDNTVQEFKIEDGAVDTVKTENGLCTATLVLDNLSAGENLRFGQQDRFKDAKTGNHLIPGEDLTVTIRVKDTSNNQIQGTSKTVTTNSLFAEVRGNDSGLGGADGRTAVIKYGRHLQNLDWKDSGLEKEPTTAKAITAAVQERDIQFKSDESDSWGVLYPTQNFVPLVNSQIKSYRSEIGSYCPVIYDLTVNTTGDAGLFKTFAGELKNIRLAGAQITGKQTVSTKFNRDGNVGGLVGKLTGETTIDGCQVYLSRAKGQLNGKTEKDIWIDGAVSGGLVGDTEFSALTIQNSLAATVIQGKTAAGGLIGDGSWELSVKGSYADCYLFSNGNAGGLIGNRAVATKSLTIQNCYTAGFLVGKTTAGLVACDLSADNNTLQNVYSACVPLTAEKLTYGTVILNKNQGDGSYAKKVYYLGKSAEPTIGTPISYSELNAADAEKLFDSTAFTRQNSDTYAYNLMKGLGLTLYSYPKLKNLPHYGDWKAEFEEGALVYYEKYADGSYGFFGANVEALSATETVKGDGYGVVYENNLPDNNVTVTVNDHPYELKPEDKIPIKVTDKAGTEKTYYLLPLPADLVQNVIDVPTGFYTELTVGAAGKAYYYNPHFAKTALAADAGAPELVSIRTARQLNNLSEYYDKYRNILPENAAFQQERDIDYAAYDWPAYGKGKTPVKEQAPIGQTEATAFKHSYDGGSHIITGVSFASGENGHAVGLFGFTEGTLENIVVTTKEPLRNAPTSKLGGNVQWKTVYTGVLAGKNSGTIKNCAVSGYRLSGNAYSGSTYYLGGLVGCNEGLIQACSADIPSITGTSTYARSYCAGGLVGMNDGSGYIRQSYALGSIKLTEIRGSAMISGFVGDNQGTIRNSYCATALTAVTGAEVNGFTSDHGSVSDCYYLSGGTYTFAGTVRLYDYKAGTNGAKAQNHEQMKTLKLDGFAKVDDAGHSINHQNTDDAEKVYPYPSSVTAGSAKTRVHYGDWVTDADMGTIGMVYWEKEEGGANSGYHFSYIGFTENTRKAGSSLCTAHDDGGKITDFGYGYYCKDGTSGDLTPSINFVLEGKNDAAAEALAQQVSGYTFTCYRTDGKDGLRLSAETKSNSDSFTLAANGTWTLNQNGKPYTYAVCPFFGDSYCPVGDVSNDAQTLGKTGAKKKYQIRSVEQLQFINWSCEVIATNIAPWWKPEYYSFTFNTGTDRAVTEDTYKQFPYLQYATVTKQGEQKMNAALSNRPQRSWTQTHDLNGMALNAPTNGTKNTVFYPIAGAVDNHTGSDYNVVLYTWFGGKYDGGNYYIKNIAIDSYCYNVGVFGTTAGATIENIMLYSDNKGVIQRSTGYTPSSGAKNADQYQCAYALGGLVGIAYDYQDNLGNSTIQNCAIAGYTVADNSKNKQQLGEAVVGGLIGVSNVNLMKCTAVVDIQINCTHRDNNENGALNAPKYGTFVRVGGIAGGVRYSVTDCYSGGTITVGKETLRERVGSGSLLDAKTLQFTNNTTFNMSGGSSPATYIFLGGIGGSGFSSNFVNFTGSTSVIDGQPTYKNCYTYVIFPKLEGTINGISLIGSVADRFGQAERLTIQNCYYLADSAKIDFSNALRAKGNSAKSSLADVYGGGTPGTTQTAARKRMLQGDLRDMASVMWGSGKGDIYSIALTERTYAQMSTENFQTKLGDGFGWVTNMENGSTIHGKYSFPGSDAALQGQDYPFPTVLQGTDSNGATVNLHYGAWPKVGMLWNEGIVSMDLIADYEPTSGAVKKLELNLLNVPEGTGMKPLEFTYSPEGVVTAEATKIETGDHAGDFAVKLKGEGTGAAEVTAKYGDYTARLMVTVTADLKVDLEKDSVDLNVGKDETVQLTAADKKDQAHPAIWTVTSDNQEVAAVTEPADGQIKVTGVTPGETQLRITATCTVGGKDYTATAILPVSVKGISGGG